MLLLPEMLSLIPRIHSGRKELTDLHMGLYCTHTHMHATIKKR